MMKVMARFLLAATFLVSLLLVSLLGACAPTTPKVTYPERPVTMVVPFAPGGGGDLSGRTLAEAAKAYFPQPITILNKEGGSGAIGAAEVLRSAPDGYTIGHLNNELLARIMLEQPNLPWKGPDDFQVITSCGTVFSVIAVRSDAPWKTLKDMVDYAKANPGKVRLSTSGTSTLTAVNIKRMIAAGIPVTLVPFEGAGPSVTAVLGGHVEGAVHNVTSVAAQLKAGQVRVLAQFAEKRFSGLSDVPTVQEAGYDIPTLVTRYVIAAPKGTPKEAVDILYSALKKAGESDSFQKFAAGQMMTLPFQSPDELRQQLLTEYAFWQEFLKTSTPAKK